MPNLKIADLNKLYSDADSCDRDIYAEQRSNVLLIAGDHYTRKSSKVFSRIRESKEVSENQKLRLTKNYIHKVYRRYVGNILSFAPGVTIIPHNDLELQDQKDAELNKAVWEDAKVKYRMGEKIRSFAQDFVGIGEVACKVFFDPNKGDFVGYKQKTEVGMQDEEYPMNDENGQPVADESQPVFKGGFVFERIFGFNLMRCPNAKSMQDSPYHIIRKMGDVVELKKMYANDPDKVKMIESSSDETFIVFDQERGDYSRAENQTMIREYYWKPCYDYPSGYFAITTQAGILDEGELPYGIYPVIFAAFDEYPTSPRGRSIIKQIRPIQGEINRASSQIAQHQITLGDDKLVYQGGTKLAPGALLPGVRGITYNGVIAPTVLPGRDGSQYMPYVQASTEELFQIAEMDEDNEPMPAQVDAYAMLYTSMKQLKKSAMYNEKFEQFLIDLCQTYLELCKHYLSDDELIYAVGRSEIVNIKEFRNTSKLCYQIKVDAKNETAETQLGRQLTMNHILQYVGPNLGKDDIGKIIRNMPFGNVEEMYRDLTIDYDVVKNDFLAMERGEEPDVNEYDNHTYIVQKVVSRMKEPDFRFLSPQIKTNYITYKARHEKFIADQAQALIDAKNEFIPVGGALIAADMYVPNPDDPNKAAKRIRIPYQSLQWLVDKLDTQGMSLDKIQEMNKGAVADLASMVASGPSKQQQQPTTNRMAGMMPSGPSNNMGRQGPASPLGVS